MSIQGVMFGCSDNVRNQNASVNHVAKNLKKKNKHI